jgi:hypothetical protein
MTNFMGSDGSGFIGAKNVAGVVQGLNVDVLGNLLVSSGAVNPNTINGAQVYYATTGQMSSANATVDAPMSIFNPSTSKNIFITSIVASSGTGSLVGILFFTTTNPAYANNLKISNAKAGGAASAISGNGVCTFVNTNQSLPGSGVLRNSYSQYYVELIPSGSGILLPAGSNNGVTAFLETYASGIGALTANWLEF